MSHLSGGLSFFSALLLLNLSGFAEDKPATPPAMSASNGKAEYYLNVLTFEAHAGLAALKHEIAAPFIDTDRRDGFASGAVTFYPVENLALRVQAQRRFEQTYGSGEFGWLVPRLRLAFTAEVMRGADGYDHALFGARYYFGGGKKSLRARHREDDPQNRATDTFHGIGNYGARYNQRAREYLATQGVAGGFSDYGDFILGFQFLNTQPPPTR
jgi:hypothetical protein